MITFFTFETFVFISIEKITIIILKNFLKGDDL